MGRKKKKQSKPWCWYCNREFDDEKILIQHQKAKHFKCHICHKKLYTGPGLSIHCMQVHKETIDKVPNSMPTRSNIEIEIYGMEGIPPEDLKEHEKQRQGRGSSPLSDDEQPPVKKKAPTEGVKPVGSVGSSGQPPPGFSSIAPPIMTPMGPMPSFMPGMGLMGTGPPTSTPSSTTIQNKPLFPSAAAIASSNEKATGSQIGAVKPTFPAYSASQSSGKSTASSSSANSPASIEKVAHINTIGASSRIIHPTEDLSLEEMRAKMPKYQVIPAGLAEESRTPTPTPSTPQPLPQQHHQIHPPLVIPDLLQQEDSLYLQRLRGYEQLYKGAKSKEEPLWSGLVRPGLYFSFGDKRRAGLPTPGLLPPASVAIMAAGPCPPIIRPPTIPIIQNMPVIRPPPMHLPPGMLGGMMGGGLAYGGGAPMFPPGHHMLTPMMPPRFR